MDTVTLTIDRAKAGELLFRLLEAPTHDDDAHEWYMIRLLAEALGEPVTPMMERRAAVFA
jgi:hypothetical protein